MIDPSRTSLPPCTGECEARQFSGPSRVATQRPSTIQGHILLRPGPALSLLSRSRPGQAYGLRSGRKSCREQRPPPTCALHPQPGLPLGACSLAQAARPGGPESASTGTPRPPRMAGISILGCYYCLLLQLQYIIRIMALLFAIMALLLQLSFCKCPE
jgi:hypothetical protein